jgi:hypothetical protein
VVAALRIKSIGLTQGAGGGGERVSLILKLPLGESKTPAPDVVCSVNGAACLSMKTIPWRGLAAARHNRPAVYDLPAYARDGGSVATLLNCFT